MDFSTIEYKDFKTFLYRSSFTSARYQILDKECMTFSKNKTEVSTFDDTKLDELFKKYEKVKIYDFPLDKYKDFKQLNLKHSKINAHITVLKFEDDFFQLNGKEYSKIRRYKNYYTKKVPLTIKHEPNNIDEVIEFIYKWKAIRKDKYFQLFIGYDINFFQNYYNLYKQNVITNFFYNGDELVGYYVMEKVNDNLYNQLFRKVNTNYMNLNLYVDYFSFCDIYKNINEPFLVNMEGDIGFAGLFKYKTENFPLFKLFKTIDIKVIRPEIESIGLF